MKSGLFVFFLCVWSIGYTQVAHPQAHAHNDYLHSRPLFDALEHGFTSIEADVHLVGEKLIVSHDHPTPDAKTLEELYLKPLDSIAKNNKGWIYPGYPRAITLMIDIKTDATQTFNVLQQVLTPYRDLVSTAKHETAVVVVISGNRDKQLIWKDPMHLATVDGRPEDLGTGISPAQMPIISESYAKVTGTKPSSAPSAADLKKINELAVRVHKEKKKLRLWAIPDDSASWRLLKASGVDIINSDKLEELDAFLKNQQP